MRPSNGTRQSNDRLFVGARLAAALDGIADLAPAAAGADPNGRTGVSRRPLVTVTRYWTYAFMARTLWLMSMAVMRQRSWLRTRYP